MVFKKQKKQKLSLLFIALFFAAMFFYGIGVFAAPSPDLSQDRLNQINNTSINNNATQFGNLRPGQPGNSVHNQGQTGYAGQPTDYTKVENDNIFVKAFKAIIYAVFVVFGWLLGVAASLFGWVADPVNFSNFLNSQSVKDVWVLVRDFLNMFFILVLLFAAFCTIFQVDKWSLQKVWLSVLLNALLVNFSFPIARFFIDIANVIMYYFLNNMFGGISNGGNIFTSLFSSSGITGVLLPKDLSNYQVSYMLMATIFIFVLAVTFLVLAVMFLIRLIALTMIVMFSPIGFVGYIFPSTSKFAGEWWDSLFKYAFFGPIMVFMMMVAMKIMEKMGTNSGLSGFASQASKQTVDMGQANFIASAAFFMIPIIILWVGMAVSQKMGIAGAGLVVGKAQGWSKSFGKWAVNTPWQATGVPGGVKLGWENFKKRGPLFGSNVTEERAARIGRLLGDRTAVTDVQSKRIKEASEKHDMTNMTENELRDIRGNQFERAAAMVELANRNRTQGTTELDTIRNQFGENSQVFRKLQAKVKTYDPASAFAHLPPAERDARIADFVNSNQFKAKDLSFGSLSTRTPDERARNAETLSIAFREQDISAADIEDLRKKNVPGVRTLIGDVAATRDAAGAYMFADVNHATLGARNREVQLAHLAQTGEFSASVAGNRAAMQRILREGNENTLKRISSHVAAGADFLQDFEDNVSQAKLIKVLPAMAEGNPDAARTIIAHLRRPGGRHLAFMAANPILAALNP